MQESRAITRKSASNLALAFVLLPHEKRDAMSALYAFCREVDDVADDEARPAEERRAQLNRWRDDVRRACEGGSPEFPVNQELKPVIQQYRLPYDCFDELICGVEMDLDTRRYQTYEQLEHYCYRVASVVGLLSIEIFGYSNPACRNYAERLGKALQFTNILRDVRADAECGRIYLPDCELQRHGVQADEILRLEYSERFESVAMAMSERAKAFYRQAHEILPAEDRRSMIAAELMGSVYWGLLIKLEQQRFNVFAGPRTKLSKLQKLLLIFRTWCRLSSGVVVPNYGTP